MPETQSSQIHDPSPAPGFSLMSPGHERRAPSPTTLRILTSSTAASPIPPSSDSVPNPARHPPAQPPTPSPLDPLPSPLPSLPRTPRARPRRPSDIGPISPLDPISPWPPVDPEPAPVTETLPSAKEVYGSLAVLLTYLAFGVYLAWAFAPAGWLDRVGWTWYPAREWATIVPCWLMVVVLLTYWSYAGLTAFLTPGVTSPSLITDNHSHIPAPTASERYYWKFAAPDAVPEAVDLPIDLVNRVLYPPRPRPQHESIVVGTSGVDGVACGA